MNFASTLEHSPRPNRICWKNVPEFPSTRTKRKYISGAVVGCRLSGYPEHVTEYGVHWNFFFTLAAVELLGRGCCALFGLIAAGRPRATALRCGLACAAALTARALCVDETWVLSDAARDSLFAANREGLASAPGYVAIHFATHALAPTIATLDDVPNDPRSRAKSAAPLLQLIFVSSTCSFVELARVVPSDDDDDTRAHARSLSLSEGGGGEQHTRAERPLPLLLLLLLLTTKRALKVCRVSLATLPPRAERTRAPRRRAHLGGHERDGRAASVAAPGQRGLRRAQRTARHRSDLGFPLGLESVS